MKQTQRILLSICIISFVGPFMTSSVNVAVPTIAREFGVLVDQLSWVLTAFVVGTAAMLLPLGRWADLHGRRLAFEAGEVLFFIATIGAGVSSNAKMLIFFRALQGISMAAVYVSYMPILLASQDREKQGHILGVVVANTYTGLSCGPFIGGFITEYLSWRCVFFIASLFIAASYLLMRTIKEEWYGDRNIGFNYVDAILSVTGVTALLTGLSSYTSAGSYHLLLWLGVLLLALFIFHESRTESAILPLSVFRNITFSMSTLTSLIHYSATYAISFLLSLQLQLILHISASVTGTILLSQPIMMALLSPRAGTLSDKFGTRNVATAGIAMTAVGLIFLALFPDITIVSTIMVLILLGIGAALFGAPNNSAIMSAVPDEQQGTAASMLALARNFGQAASMALVTLILSHVIGSMASYEAAITQGIHITFIILSVLCCCAVVTSWVRGK